MRQNAAHAHDPRPRGRDRRRRVLRDRRRHQARQGRLPRLRRARGGRRRGRRVALEHLPGRRGRHPVVQLPVLVRDERRLVARLRPRERAQGVCRALRRQIRRTPAHPSQHEGRGGDLRRRAAPVAHRYRRRRGAHRALRGGRDRRVHEAQAARHPRPRRLHGHRDAHLALGPRPGPARQARGRGRHRRVRGPGDPVDRPARREPRRSSSARRSGACPSSTARSRARCARCCGGYPPRGARHGSRARPSSRRRSRCPPTSTAWSRSRVSASAWAATSSASR